MNSNPNDDEWLVNSFINRRHKDAYEAHLRDATRNLSVDVVAAMHAHAARTRRQRRMVVGGLAVAASIGFAWLVLPEPDPVPVPSNNLVTGTTSSTETLTEDLLVVLTEEEAVDRIVQAPTQQNILLTSSDVDKLLEGL